MTQFTRFIKALARDDRGQDLVEYVLLLVIIVLAVGLAIVAFRGEITSLFNKSAAEVASH